MNKNLKNLLILSVGLLVSLFLWHYSRAQTGATSSKASANPDAIAVRIIPNPNHYSITRWYADQGFQGSPQSLVVDGYNAIRDGRTVYVNAANVDANKNIYTNIYLISYNQDSTANTVDILGQIISHWKFNDNLSNVSGSQPTCSVSSLSCSQDSDCTSGQYCATSGLQAGTCQLKTPVDCSVDTDCPTSFFCDSLKAKVTRDVKRMGQLEEMKIALTNFKNSNGHYPLLSSGSYLPGNSVSLWPSWTQSLLSDLAVAPTLTDPVNRLGACQGYNQTTCWNPDKKEFFSKPSSNATLVLPAGSYALAYASNGTGSDYHICATLESKALGYKFAPTDPAASSCVTAIGVGEAGAATNTPPQLQDDFLNGQAHQEFNGFIRVTDANSDPLQWSLTPASGVNWNSWQSGRPPILKDTSNPYQKNVYSASAGNSGTYNMNLTVKDGRGGVLTTTTPIVINLPSISISAQNSTYSLDSGNPFNYSFSFSGQGLSTTPRYSTSGGPNTYFLTKVSGPFDLSIGLNRDIKLESSHSYKVTYSGTIPGAKLSQGADFVYEIKVTDSNKQTSTKDFRLRISPSTLNFQLNCPDTVRILNPYSCNLANGQQGLTFKVTGLPAGLTATQDGKISGSPSDSGLFDVSVEAQNSVGASAQASFNLKVNTYCGDHTKETPNSEGTGGPKNDGQESCDGSSGVTSNPVLSSITFQYGCQPGPTGTTTYPILTKDQCVFSQPLDGGGYCGDGYCEARASNGQTLETCDNCARDCGACIIDNTPRVMTWHGKVNQHWDISAETWATDPDGTSGSNVNLLAYCNKFYPGTSSVEPYKMETSNAWRNAGNTGGPFTSTQMSYQCIKGSSSSNANKVMVSGTVKSYAHYGYPSKALANVRVLFSDSSGASVATALTDSSGNYQVRVPVSSASSPKTYTADASLSGYSDTVQTITPSTDSTLNFLMSTPAYTGVNKIQLSWGATPPDLDSHLTFGVQKISSSGSGTSPSCFGSDCTGTTYLSENHVWWPPQYHNVASSSLDVDATQGYGPENIRIKQLVTNNYNYDVYNYSRCYANDSNATFGSATVTVYNSHNGVIKVFHADPSQTSCYWHVFSIDSQDNITPINTYNNTGPQAHL